MRLSKAWIVGAALAVVAAGGVVVNLVPVDLEKSAFVEPVEPAPLKSGPPYHLTAKEFVDIRTLVVISDNVEYYESRGDHPWAYSVHVNHSGTCKGDNGTYEEEGGGFYVDPYDPIQVFDMDGFPIIFRDGRLYLGQWRVTRLPGADRVTCTMHIEALHVPALPRYQLSIACSSCPTKVVTLRETKAGPIRFVLDESSRRTGCDNCERYW